MTDFIYGIGNVMYLFFYQFEKLQNLPNNLFVVMGFVLLFWWMSLQKKYNTKAENEGAFK